MRPIGEMRLFVMAMVLQSCNAKCPGGSASVGCGTRQGHRFPLCVYGAARRCGQVDIRCRGQKRFLPLAGLPRTLLNEFQILITHMAPGWISLLPSYREKVRRKKFPEAVLFIGLWIELLSLVVLTKFVIFRYSSKMATARAHPALALAILIGKTATLKP
jgi:hypothetical protein